MAEPFAAWQARHGIPPWPAVHGVPYLFREVVAISFRRLADLISRVGRAVLAGVYQIWDLVTSILNGLEVAHG